MRVSSEYNFVNILAGWNIHNYICFADFHFVPIHLFYEHKFMDVSFENKLVILLITNKFSWNIQTFFHSFL